MPMRRLFWLAAVGTTVWSLGCSDANGSVSTADSEPFSDSGIVDTAPDGNLDTSTSADAEDLGVDTNVGDVGFDGTSDSPLGDSGLKDSVAETKARPDILGDLTGSCGFVSELDKKTPSYFDDTLTFKSGEKFVKESLSAGGKIMLETANAGGSSGESETMSFEVLYHCDEAVLFKTETEIGYTPPDGTGANSITDLEVIIAGRKVGVSVTRAYKPLPMTLSDADVQTLIEKKLAGVNRSSVRVLPADKWVKQILHVFASSAENAAAVRRVYAKIDPILKADTIVLTTQTAGGGFIYCNPDPPLGTECPSL